MNRRQKAFCEYFLLCHNASEAARKAGYKYPSRDGYRNLQHPEIKKYVDENEARIFSEAIADKKETLEFLTRTMRDKNASTKDRLKAAHLLGNYMSLFDGEQKKTAEQNHIKIEIVGEANADNND